MVEAGPAAAILALIRLRPFTSTYEDDQERGGARRTLVSERHASAPIEDCPTAVAELSN